MNQNDRNNIPPESTTREREEQTITDSSYSFEIFRMTVTEFLQNPQKALTTIPPKSL